MTTRLIIQTNALFGYGYQVALKPDDGSWAVLDYRPYRLSEAVKMARKALQIINRHNRSKYMLEDVLHIEVDALELNRKYDFISARIWKAFQQNNME